MFSAQRGPRSIVLARFVPIGVGITTVGYYLGEIDLVKHNLQITAVGIVALSLIPVGLEVARSYRPAVR